jgi:hypothetical protein
MAVFGKLNGSYVDGKHTRPNFCICGREIASKYAKHCKSCGEKFKIRKPRKEPNKNFCSCGKQIDIRSKRCRNCESKRRMSIPSIKEKLISKIKGPNNHWYKHGLTPLVNKIRNLPESRKWRLLIYKRDNYTCQECFVHAGRLEAHHIKPFHLIFKEYIKLMKNFNITSEEKLLRLAKAYKPFWELTNGITNCFKCHRKKPRK